MNVNLFVKLINVCVEHPKHEVIVFDIVMVYFGQGIIMWSISKNLLSRFR